MYFYVISKDSTRVLPTAAHAEYQQEVPAGDSPLICTLSSTHSAEKFISIGECWMVIGQCKKSARVRLVDQSHGPYISCCSHQNHHNLPCFGSSNSSVATFSGEFQYDMALKQPVVIKVPDDDFPDSGPQNPVEAQSYRDQLNAIMSMFSDLLVDNQKDALRSTITSLKILMVKHWQQMAKADVDVVLWSIHDSNCVYLWQHLTTEGVDVVEPVTDVPEGWTFLRQLPEKVWKMEVQELIVSCFDHLSEVHAHMSSFVANISLLAKIADPKTFDMVMKAAARLMIQVNIPEHYLSLVQDPPPKTTAEEYLSRLEKVILPQPTSLTQEPWYRPTRLLAAVVWLHLKCKFFNGGTAKEACTMFEVWAKQLSKLLSGKVYLGGSAGAAKGKHKQSHTVAHEGDVTGDEPPSPSPLQEVNVIVTGSSSTGGTKMGIFYNYIRVTTCNCLPPPQLSVWLSVAQIGRTKFLSQNFPFQPFLNG